jgi:hypothetical protein
LGAALHAERAAKDEDLRAPYVALGEGPVGRNAARHAEVPVVFGAQVAG